LPKFKDMTEFMSYGTFDRRTAWRMGLPWTLPTIGEFEAYNMNNISYMNNDFNQVSTLYKLHVTGNHV